MFARRSLQDVLQTSSRRFHEEVLQLCLEVVLEDIKMWHWRRLQDVFKTSSVRLHQDECLLGLMYKKSNLFVYKFVVNYQVSWITLLGCAIYSWKLACLVTRAISFEAPFFRYLSMCLYKPPNPISHAKHKFYITSIYLSSPRFSRDFFNWHFFSFNSYQKIFLVP